MDEGVLIDKAIQMLEVFVAEVRLPDEVVDVERAFSLELYDPNTGEALDVPLIGAIDAVMVENGNTVLWELKTGKRRWSLDQLAYDLQPTAYLLAMQEEKPAMKLVLTTKGAKPAVQIEPLTRSAADEDDLAYIARGVLRGVGAGVDHPIRGWQCKGCPYMAVCS